MTEKELTQKLSDCSFVIMNPNKCAVAIKDIPQGFAVVAKGLNNEAKKIVAIAENLFKLVVEAPEEAEKIYNEIEVDVPFNKYDEFLIDIMEEFRLIKTGSKKPQKQGENS